MSKKSKKRTVLVTGASGRIGKALISELIKKRIAVRALVQRHEEILHLPSGSVPYVGQIGSERLLSEACEGVDTVFHLAAIVSQFKAHPNEILRVNTEGTKRILEASESAGVRHLIFPSSVDVYGRKRSEMLTEESEPRPTDIYGYSKMLAEKAIMEYDGNLNYTIFRLAVVYGPGFEASFFKVFKAIKDGKARIIGNGRNHLAFIHVSDAIRAMFLANEKYISNGKIYNLSDGRIYTQEYLFDLAADLLKVPRPRKHISPFLVGIVARARGLNTDEIRFITSNRMIDTTRIRKELGFEAKVDIKEGSQYLINRFLQRIKNA